MGFLDKLFGRAKTTATDIAEQAAPMVDRAVDKAGDLAHQAKDAAAPMVDKAQDLAGQAADKASELVDRAKDSGAGDAGTDTVVPPAADASTPPSDRTAS